MAENEEKLLAVARHIAKTLGHNPHMADDILQIFSNFDGRFSREKLSDQGNDEHSRNCAALEHTLKSLDRRITRYVTSDQPVWADSADASAFLDAIDELVASINDWNSMAGDKSVGACLVRAEDLLQQSMFRFEDEFRSLMERGGESFVLTSGAGGHGQSDLTRNFDSEDEHDAELDGELEGDDHIPVAKPITDYHIVIDALPSGTLNDLHDIAKRMLAAGFGEECSHVYSSCRREFLEESLSRLGLLKLSIDGVHKMSWQDLEDEIARWIKASNVALRILFPSERRLCDRVFWGFSSAAALSFMEVCRGSTIQLLNFADAVAIGSRAPERLFKILDVFETMRDLLPEFELKFSDQYCVILRNEAITIWKRLGEAIRGTFMELENLIRRDPAKKAVPGGGVHPITRYVMNYLLAACRSRQTLEQVFEENVVPSKPDVSLSSSFPVQIAWVMELLESNLGTKSKIYKDSALCSVFMMNNGKYILQKAQDTELGSLLGDDWIRKHAAKVRQYQVNYQRGSWNKVLSIIKLDNVDLAPNQISKSMKEKLKMFNMHFEEICRIQSTWVVYDEQLREEIRISLAKILLPAYGNFIGRFRNVPEIGKSAGKYIRYGTEDIKANINGLFGGKSSADGGK